MLPLGGRPILEHVIGHLSSHGITEIAINTHYLPPAITEYFGDGHDFGVSITYAFESELLGSAGAAKQLEWFLTDPFVVWYGDVLSDLDVTALSQRHRASGALATLSLYEVDEPWRCGIVETDPAGAVVRFIEKPAPGSSSGNRANAGIYIVDPELLRWIPAGQKYDFGTDLFPKLIAAGVPLCAVDADAYVLDIGSIERYTQAEADLRSGRFRSSLMAYASGTRAC